MEDILTVIMRLTDPFTAYSLSLTNRNLYQRVKKQNWYHEIVYIANSHWWNNKIPDYKELIETRNYLLKPTGSPKVPSNRLWLLAMLNSHTQTTMIRYLYFLNEYLLIEMAYKCKRLGLDKLLGHIFGCLGSEKMDKRLIPFGLISSETILLYKKWHQVLTQGPVLEEELTLEESLGSEAVIFFNIFLHKCEWDFIVLVKRFLRNELKLRDCNQVLSSLDDDRANAYVEWLRTQEDFTLDKIPMNEFLTDINFNFLMEVYQSKFDLEKEMERESKIEVYQSKFDLEKEREYIVEPDYDSEFYSAALEFNYELMEKYLFKVSLDTLRDIRENYEIANENSICYSLVKREIERRKRTQF